MPNISLMANVIAGTPTTVTVKAAAAAERTAVGIGAAGVAAIGVVVVGVL